MTTPDPPGVPEHVKMMQKGHDTPSRDEIIKRLDSMTTNPWMDRGEAADMLEADWRTIQHMNKEIDRLRAELERKSQRVETAEHLLTLARQYMRNYDMGDLRGIDGWDDDVSDFLRTPHD